MRRYFRYIFLALILGILAMSCIEELDAPQIMQENEELTLVPRVKSFTNHYVTKSDYTGLETTIKKVSILVFDSDGKLVHLHEGSGESVIINKSMLNSSDTQTEKLEAARIVMFANMNLSDIKKGNWSIIQNQNEAGLTPEDLKNYVCNFVAENTVIPAPLTADFEGFPMVGSKTLDLTSTTAKQDPVTVDLQILYAKINFSISAEAGTENEVYEGKNVSFALKQYSVHNASMATKLEDITASETAADAATESRNYAFSDAGTTITATGNQFTFYVAENRYNPYTGSKPDYPDYASLSEMGTIYPLDWLTQESELDVKDPAEDQPNGVKYFYDDKIQQYKPNLVTKAPAEAGKPTYVTLTGVYTDYRGTLWDVDYDIYLGKDNAHNFHVDRNSEYTNQITIKGIRNRQEGAYGEGEVWIDHRVDVSLNSDSPNKGADCVTITRETLIDSHIEVRPLRVKWDGDTYAGVKVYLPTDDYGALLNWIGIERFTGSNCQDGSTYCYQQGKSIGKRRYFTDDLIPELQTKGGEFGVNEQDGKKFIYLQNGDCAWIYFDENTFTDGTRNGARTASIKLEFVDDSGKMMVEEIYNVEQAGLHVVTSGDYSVELYEEYLHSYDSVDKYNLSTTPADYTQQGLAWGLTNGTISQDIIVSATPLGLGMQQYISQRYDYFHTKDVTSGSYHLYLEKDGNWDSTSAGIGLDFTNRATYNIGISIKDMGTVPESAYQYCLSKNKFKADDDGNVTMTLHWYLPDIYQLEHILNDAATNAAVVDFNPEDYYWSSQPSYTSSVFSILGNDIGLLNEASGTARARSKNDGISDQPRSSKHRIRCLYDKTGKVADMTDRTPDGVGGLSTFIMKGYIDISKSEYGYFKNSVKDLSAQPESNTEAEWPDTNYPTKSNSYNVSGAEFNYVVTTDKDDAGNIIEGFEVKPTLTNSWNEYMSGYYHTLRTYPGLTQYTLDSLITWNGSYAYKPTSTKKSVVEIKTSSSTKKLDKNLPSDNNLDYLDHLKGSKMFNISFTKSDGTSDPVYIYDETVSGTVTTNTYNWSVPVYKEVQNKKEQDEYTLETSEYSYSSKDAAQTAGDNASAKFTGYSTIKVTVESQWQIIRTRYRYVIKGITYKKYYPLEKAGEWTMVSSVPDNSSAKINTDELRLYSGNSIKISLSDQIDEDGVKYSKGYEITKIKVYYSGDNLIDDNGIVNKTYVYARFVDEEIYSKLPLDGDGSTHLSGWDYDDTAKTQQWAGEGRSSVTLNLADYVATGYSLGSIYNDFNYEYAKASLALDKYIVIDKIEVKCTKKSTE